MKTFPFVRLIAFELICLTTTISAQNLADQESGAAARPSHEKADALIPDSDPLCLVKNSLTLDSRLNTATDMSTVIDVNVLRDPSIYRGGPHAVSSSSEEILRNNLAQLSATYRESAKTSGGPASEEVAMAVRQRIKINPSRILEIVADEITANPASACEIVKAAVQTTDAETPLVISIVNSAIHASPESMRMISQCAIASAPESLSAIQALLAELDPNGGDAAPSAKGAKNAVAAIIAKQPEAPRPNPLDLPRRFPIPPPSVIPPLVSNVDPR